MIEVELVPAIMPEDIDDLGEKLARVLGLVKTVQLDLMDGHFVKPRTWPYNNKDAEILQSILREEEGLPYWDQFDFEFDLMVAQGGEDLDLIQSLGAKRIVFHLEKDVEHQKNMLKAIASIDPYLRESMQIGLALPIEGDVDDLMPFIEQPAVSGRPFIDFIQCMGIAEIGYQGHELDERVIYNIERLRKAYGDITISIDGGVNVNNAADLVRAGATRLVIGSALFESFDIEETLKEFAQIVHNEIT